MTNGEQPKQTPLRVTETEGQMTIAIPANGEVPDITLNGVSKRDRDLVQRTLELVEGNMPPDFLQSTVGEWRSMLSSFEDNGHGPQAAQTRQLFQLVEVQVPSVARLPNNIARAVVEQILYLNIDDLLMQVPEADRESANLYLQEMISAIIELAKTLLSLQEDVHSVASEIQQLFKRHLSRPIQNIAEFNARMGWLEAEISTHSLIRDHIDVIRNQTDETLDDVTGFAATKLWRMSG